MSDKLLVVLDPGHYPRYNKGAASGYYEGDKMWDLTQYQKAALSEYNNVDVIVTRKQTEDKELYDRGQVAVKNASKYSNVLFISNHSNAFNGEAYGVVAFRSAHLNDSVALGKSLVNAVVDVMRPTTKRTYSRGVSIRQLATGADYYGVIRGAVSYARNATQAKKSGVKYAYIIEHGFHDNPTECAFLNKPENLKKIALAEVAVIAKYFGLKKKETEKPTTSTSSKNTPYTVKVSINNLNIRKGPGTNYGKNGFIKPGVYTIVAESTGTGATKWGKLKSGAGWISLDYAKP